MTQSYDEPLGNVVVQKSEMFVTLKLLASERSERDTIRCVQIRAGAVYIYIYICMEVHEAK